jgi:acylglycerol lipase
MNKLSSKDLRLLPVLCAILVGSANQISAIAAHSMLEANAVNATTATSDGQSTNDHKKKIDDGNDAALQPATSTLSTGAPCISWVNPMVTPRVAMLCIHGLGLYSGSYNDLGLRLSRSGIATFAIDVRGFGSWMKAKGEQDLDFDSCLDDIKSAVQSIHQAYPGLPVFLLGESMGGAIALRFASQHPDMIEGLISSVPAGERFKQKKTDVKVAMQLFKHPNKQFDIGDRIVDQATQSEALRQEWASNPLDRMDLSAKQLLHFQHFMNENHECAKQITTLPVLFLQGTQDKLVKPEGTWELFNELTTPHKVFLAVPSEHLIFEDTEHEDEITKARTVRMVTAWIFTHTANASNLTPKADLPELSSAITKLVAGQYADAQKSLEQLALSEPMSGEVHYWLGLAYLKTKQPLLARKQFVRSIALGKGSHTAKQANNYLLNMTDGGSRPVGASTSSQSPEVALAAKMFKADTQDLTGGKPAVLAFYAKWCEQCDKLDNLFKHGESMFNGQIKFLKIDVDDQKNQRLVKDFKIGPIPTLIYLKKDGTVVSTSIGESGFVNFADGLSALVRN